MAPKKTTTQAAPESEVPPVIEEYSARMASARDELAAQPWDTASQSDDSFEEGANRKTLVETMPGGGVKITEAGKTKMVKHDSAGKRIAEAEAGDTFTRTLYSEGGMSEGYLNNESRVLAMRQSLIMYRDDPMYRAVIDGFVYFIIGKGLKFKARDENPIVQEHLEAFWKENKMSGRDTDIVRRFLKFGECLIRYYKTGAAGAMAKIPRVRLIPFWRLDRFTVDAQDTEKITAFKLMNFNPDGFSTASVQVEDVAPEDVQYLVNSENDGGRGEPPFLVVMRSCKWYADFLLNRVVLNRYRSAFVLFKKITNAGPGRVSSVDSSSSNATKTGKNGQAEKRLPKSGTVVIHNSSIEYDWKAPNTGAVDGKVDGDLIKSYIAAGAMVPEFLLGDASQANQDNSLVADNPFVRKVEFYQDFFEDVFAEMFKRVITQGIESGKIPKTSTETTITESNWVMKRVRRALRALHVQEATEDGELEQKKSVPTKTQVDITWPTLIQKNSLQEAQTLQIDAALGLVSVETMRGKRGYDDALEEQRMERDRQQANDYTDQQRQAEIDAMDAEDKSTKDKGVTS